MKVRNPWVVPIVCFLRFSTLAGGHRTKDRFINQLAAGAMRGAISSVVPQGVLSAIPQSVGSTTPVQPGAPAPLPEVDFGKSNSDATIFKPNQIFLLIK